VLADDLGRGEVGAYGATPTQTPTLDALANAGVRFDNAFVTEAMCAPSRSSILTGLYPVRHGSHRNHGTIKPGVLALAHYLKPLGYKVVLAGKTHIKPLAQFEFDEVLGTNQVPDFIARSKNTRFLLYYASNQPHAPHALPTNFKGSDVEVYPNWVDTPTLRETVAGYYEDVLLFDSELAVIDQALTKNELTSSTLTIATSDHGNAWYAKWTLYDAGLRVPFIARWPGIIAQGTRSAAMFSFVDLLPTFVDLAGGQPPTNIDGQSFAEALLGHTQQHRDVVFASHTTRGIIGGSTYPVRAVRTKTLKYLRNLNANEPFTNTITETRGEVWDSWVAAAKTSAFAQERVTLYQHRPAEELYDLENDPFELVNLGQSPAHQEQKLALSAQLDAFMAQQGDLGLETELAAAVANPNEP
jgi:uncharacterized sulfatase